ncbi:MAG: YaiI/YqxD family protein [Rhizobiales bacterium]|nr:YaiI/YqxD family protein [Hyphomicrobiales bacterium]NRB12780.1 YaiI/YqxD family protein [Hyphomicrobiales bacterium]
MNTKNIVIFIDADACPVKDEILKVSYRHKLKVYMVSNQWLRMEVGALVEKIVVSEGADEADDWIAEHIDETGICITSDIPLAKRCLDAGGIALGPTGKVFSRENIGMALAMRELNQHLRETGESKGHNPSFTKADRSQFLQALETAIQNLIHNR